MNAALTRHERGINTRSINYSLTTNVSIYYTLNRQTLLTLFFKVVSMNSLIILIKNTNELIVSRLKNKTFLSLLAQYFIKPKAINAR
jgi:hypothetical protein